MGKARTYKKFVLFIEEEDAVCFATIFFNCQLIDVTEKVKSIEEAFLEAQKIVDKLLQV